MNILISGGSGFLGRALSQALIEHYRSRHETISITWLTRDSRQAHPDTIHLMDYEAFTTTDAHYDVIINLAGAGIADKRWSDARKEQLLASRVKPTESILAYIARTAIKPTLLVSGSAIGWYGTQGDQPLNEASGYEKDFAHKLCDDWEKLALQATDYGVPVAIVRTGIVIHPSGGMLNKLLTPFKMGVGGQLGDGQQVMSWISRDDWVRATIFIIEQQLSSSLSAASAAEADTSSQQGSIYNLTAPNPVSNRQFTKTVGAWLQRPTIFTLPTWLLKLMFGEMSTLLVDGQNVLPTALLSRGFEFKHPTLRQALEKQA